MTRTGWIVGSLLALGALSGPAAGQTASPPVTVSEVSVDSTNGTTVLIKTSGAAKYHARRVRKPPRLVIDLEDTVNAVPQEPPLGGGDDIKQIRLSQATPTVTRVVIEFAHPLDYKIAATAAGLAVTLSPVAVAAAAAERRAPREPAARADAPPASEATQPTPAPPAGSRLISLDFKDADVVNLLRILAAESGKNIVIGDDVKGKMSITLRNVPWETALDTILETRGLRKLERDNLLRIVSNEQLGREQEAEARLAEAKAKAEADVRQKIADAKKAEQALAAAEQAQREAEARGPLREVMIRLSYADPVEVTKTLQGILGIPPIGRIEASPLTPSGTTPIAPGPNQGPPPIAMPPFSQLYGTAPPPAPGPAPVPSAEALSRGLTIQASPSTNSIFVRWYERDLERLVKLVRETLDIPLPQVKIEARLEEIQRSALEAIGVSWGGGGATALNNRAAFVGQGITTQVAPGGAVPLTGGGPISGALNTAALPSGIGVNNLSLPNRGLTLNNPAGTILPVNPTTGLPTGGSLVNLLPLSSLGQAFGLAPVTAGFGFGIINSKFNIDLALQALATESKTRTLSRPEIVTVENKEATIAIGEQIPYATVSSAGTQIQFVSANLQLTVKPHVILERDATKIKMRVVVDNNSPGAQINLGGNGSPPAINTEHAETEVLMREGERLVIGGVGVTTDVDSQQRVPLLGNIPLLGWLFKNRGVDRETRELVVFITPSVLRFVPPPPAPTQ